MTDPRPPRALQARALAWLSICFLLPVGPLLAAPAPPRPAGAPWLHKNAPGTLSVVGTAGAALAVDGVAKGKLPLAPLALKAGPHAVELKKEGFATLRRKVTLKVGEAVRLTLELTPLKVAASLPLPGDSELPPLIAAGVPLPPPASGEEGPGSTLKGVRTVPPVPVGQAPQPAPAVEVPLIVVGGELVRADSVPTPVPAPEAARVVEAHAVPVEIKAAPPQAVAAPPEAVVAGTLQPGPVTQKWWFWGGVGAAALVVVAGVIYALPPTYVETRDPLAGCGGTCGVVVNK